MIDDSLSGAKVQHAPPPQEARYNNKDIPFLPEEITYRVIGYVVGDGLRVSNGARYDVDLETIRSLLKTSVSIRRETLRQVFRRPLRFCLSGEKTCDCKPLLESIGHKECRCTLLLEKILRLPLSKWTALVVHFTPLIPAVAAQEVEVGVDGADDLQGDDQQQSEQQTSRQTAVDDGGWAARGEFLAVVQRVKHYSRSLSTTLYFLLKQRANLSCDAACCGVIEMSRRRHYGPVYCSYDPKFPALPFDVSFVFESPPVDVLGGGGEDHTLIPLWTMNMVNGLLMPWWRFITKRGVSQQIKLPSSIAAAFTMGRDRISQEFPHKPTAVAERLQRDFADFWAVKPGLIPSYDAVSLWPCVVNFDGSFEWYLNPAPLKQAPTRWTIRGVPVLRIVVPEPDLEEQGDGGDDSGARWTGEFLASDG